MTLDEFGQDLFEAIKIASSRQQCLAMKGQKMAIADRAAWQQKADALQAQLLAILERGTISPDDVRKILARHGA